MIDIKRGDCRDVLKTLEEKSVHTCITSPPYYGLRDYQTGTWEGGDPNCTHQRMTKISKDTSTGHRGMYDQGNVVGDAIYKTTCNKCGATRKDKQIGLESTPDEYVQQMVEVFREVRRVLRDDGTVWLNLGDTYSNFKDSKSTPQTLSKGTQSEQAHEIDEGLSVSRDPRTLKQSGLKNKDLIGIPWRVALALQSDGWYLRQDIIWHKPNPMPESVKDRCTKSHEYIFLLSKQPNYYYDYEAIKEKATGERWGGNKPINMNNTKDVDNQFSGLTRERKMLFNERNKRSVWTVQPVKENKTYGKYKDQETEAKNRQGLHSDRGDKLIEVRNGLPDQLVLVEFLRSKVNAKTLADNTDIPLTKIEHWFRKDKAGFSYPTIEDWKKIREFIDDFSNEFHEIDKGLSDYDLKTDEVVVDSDKNKRSVWTVTTKPFKKAHFAVFPTELIEPCVLAGCPEGGTVLDPFGGSGTTGLVADRHKRNAVLIELNNDYIDIAEDRLKDDAPLFSSVQRSK